MCSDLTGAARAPATPAPGRSGLERLLAVPRFGAAARALAADYGGDLTEGVLLEEWSELTGGLLRSPETDEGELEAIFAALEETAVSSPVGTRAAEAFLARLELEVAGVADAYLHPASAALLASLLEGRRRAFATRRGGPRGSRRSADRCLGEEGG